MCDSTLHIINTNLDLSTTLDFAPKIFRSGVICSAICQKVSTRTKFVKVKTEIMYFTFFFWLFKNNSLFCAKAWRRNQTKSNHSRFFEPIALSMGRPLGSARDKTPRKTFGLCWNTKSWKLAVHKDWDVDSTECGFSSSLARRCRLSSKKNSRNRNA